MENITVNKEELLTILRKNRDEHRDIFLRAQEVFRVRIIEELERKLDDAKKGVKIDTYIRLVNPEDHTEDYERVIRMLELSVDGQVILSERDVQMYVQNEWGWAGSFAANTTSYLAQ